MPVAGPRTQTGPVPGYTNPEHETPTFFNRWLRPGPVAELGRTPGLQVFDLRGNVLGAGQIRKLWRQAANEIFAQWPYSRVLMAPAPGRGIVQPQAIGVTRALRYMTRSLYMGTGIDNSEFAAIHTTVNLQARGKPVTQGMGGKNRPTVRNRMTSFGSRVAPLNPRVVGAESSANG
jgi:hypothetical protein